MTDLFLQRFPHSYAQHPQVYPQKTVLFYLISSHSLGKHTFYKNLSTLYTGCGYVLSLIFPILSA